MSIHYALWALNPRPSEHEPPPITTRPGFQPNVHYLPNHSFQIARIFYLKQESNVH